MRLFKYMLVLCPAMMFAQDLHFSQYMEHHALINPGLTGTEDVPRAVLGYKSQWKKAAGTPFKTYGASYETKVLGGSWKKADKLPKKYREQNIGRVGAGASVYKDKAGEGAMSLTQVNVSTAAFLPVSHWSYLSLGIQAGMAFRKVDQTDLIYPNQYVPGGYDAGINSNEEVPWQRYKYFDLGTGLVWTYAHEDKKFTESRKTTARFGVAAYHLTQPNLRVIGNREEKLYMKLVVHGDMLFAIKKSHLMLNPMFLFQYQGPAKELVAGAVLKYYPDGTTSPVYTTKPKKSCFDFGLHYRAGDAIIMQFMYEHLEHYAFGLSYDLNVSKLRTANKMRGGPELMVRITPQKDFQRQKK